jgi:hypothetical protein
VWFLLSACLGSVTRTATTQAIPKEKRMKVICNVSDLEMQQSIELYESRLPKIWEEQWPISDLLIFVPCPLLALSRHS